MTRPASGSLALGTAAALVVAAVVPLAFFAHTPGNVAFLALEIPFAAVGVIIVRRQRRNAIGWVMVALALGSAVGTDGGLYGLRAYHLDRHGLPLSRLAVALAPLAWVSVLTLLPLPIMLFPDGRIPPGRWRVVFWAYVAAASTLVVSVAADDAGAFTHRTIAVDSNGQLASMNGSQHGTAAVVNLVGIVVYAALALAGVGRQLLRYRHSLGVERQQLKWLLSGGAVAVTGLVIATQASNSSPLSALFVAIVALPASIGVAILRYRLYEIDRLISRTITYALLTASLAAVFGGLVVLLTDVLPFSSPVAVAASTLAAAALFAPLRRRLQQLIDRRFNRARYDAQATVAAFTGRLRDAIDLESISGELLGVVDQAVAPAHASVWIKAPLGER
jgi:hypothetical protein